MGRALGPRCALAAKLTLANRNENAEEVIFSGEEEGCQEEGHQEEGCEEEEVTFLDLARPQGIGRRPVGQSPNNSTAGVPILEGGSATTRCARASASPHQRRSEVERP
jgi:hypothetical protein